MSRLEKTLGILLFLLLLLGALVAYFFWQQARLDATLDAAVLAESAANRPPLAARVVEGVSALMAAGQAQQKVTGWQEDAALIRGQAVWPAVERPDDLLSGESSWQFTYYSAAEKASRTATTAGDETTLEPAVASELTLVPMQMGSWQVNSSEAAKIFLDNGGREFIQNEQPVSLTMNLNMVADSRQPEWLVAALSPQTGRSFTMIIHATSGEILAIIGP